jgi:hypothetical protein
MDLEFGDEFRPFGGFGLGGYIEGMERGGVANRINQMLMTPEQKFASSLNFAFENINDFIPLDRNARDTMEKFAEKMPHMSYKNATTFVLGCIASVKNKKNLLNTNQLKKVFSILYHFKDTENISTSDVIRYARFAMLNNFDDEVLMSGNDYDLSSSESSSSDDD